MTSQASTISASKVFRLGVGGAIGGLITYFLLDPGMRESERQATGEMAFNHGLQAAMEGFALGAVIGAAIGAMLILADEIQDPKLFRMARNLIFGAFVGALIGCVGVFVADMVFTPLARTGALPIVIIGRTLGWAIMGIAAGLCPGIVAGSNVRIKQGALGGLIGGGIGGILFDVLAGMTSGGSVSRFVGFTITGLAIGVAVGLIEEFGKVYWLTALSGGREGRNFILAKPVSVLGRDELVDIPVFGDVSVLKRHATVALSPAGASIIAQPGASVVVNGVPMPNTVLQDGDVVEFGRQRFRFHSRAGVAPYMAGPAEYRPVMPLPQSTYAPVVQMTAGAQTACSRVTVVGGPHSGLVFMFTNGAIIGRDARCDLALISDVHLSRQHARFVLEGMSWVIEDGNSTNGITVNGLRVSRQVLSPGDIIGAGDTKLNVS